MAVPSDDISDDKETVSLEQEELDILDAIRAAAPEHHVDQELAQTYGVWTVCFRRYCQEKGVPWLWMSSVSDFMDFLDAHPDVSTPERERALDGIMFYITDVHKTRQEDEPDDDPEASSVPRSTQSLFAKMLLRCDVQLTEALRIRFEDVNLEEAEVTVSGETDRSTRTIPLPASLNEGLKHHLERVDDRTDAANPLLFGHRGGDKGPGTASTEDDIERSTELATRVMRTFDKELSDEEE
jgi:hypothetical protein